MKRYPAGLVGGLLLLSAVLPASAASITADPNDPGLADTAGSVVGNETTSAPGFGIGSWQATGVKSNFYVTPQMLFGHDVTIGDVASISFWTNRADAPGTANWSLYIYTTPTASDNSASWYKSRLVAVPGAGDNTWTQWGTDSLQFSDPSRDGGVYTGTNVFLADLVSGPVTWGITHVTRDYSSEVIRFFSVQTDSGATGFTGLVDGLQVNLANETSASVNFEPVPEPATMGLTGLALVAVLARMKKRASQAE